MTGDELLHVAETEPLNVDISDFSDDFVAGFLAGQRNALEEAAAGRLDAGALRDLLRLV